MDNDPSRADRSAREGPVGEAAAWTVLSYLISGPLIYGGLGWLLDLWLGTHFIVAIGLVGGMALSFVVINRRYLSPPPQISSPAGGHRDRPASQ
jgi:F0F1-type ATP synthase assembly protein I